MPNLFSNIFSKLTLTSFAHSLTHFVRSLTHSLSLVPLATARLSHSFVLSSLSLAHSLRWFRSLTSFVPLTLSTRGVFEKMLENKFLTEGTLLPLLTLLLLQTLQTFSPLERPYISKYTHSCYHKHMLVVENYKIMRFRN